MTTVCIIGGGASGMAAALTAAAQGRHAVLLERQARVGRKLLATGNGRCNLTNRHAAPSHYHGADVSFCAPALERFGVDDTLAWLEELGLLTVTEDSGRVYPYSNMAGSVVDVLRYALEDQGVEVHTGCTVTSLRRKGNCFTITTEDGQFTARQVILAAGGAAGSQLGGVMDGYRLAKGLGHHRTALYPALVQLKTEPTYPRALKGVKAQAALEIRRDREVLARGSGEILFTEYGVSGPAIFDLSRTVSTAGDGLMLHLDFLPQQQMVETLALLQRQRQRSGSRPALTLLSGALHSRLGQMVCKAAGSTAGTAGELADEALEAIARQVHDFTLPILGTCSFDQAQVTAGGLRTDEFCPRTLESLLVPGLYACGEVLDIDGDCGGYNLQWAWSSGRLAGRTEHEA